MALKRKTAAFSLLEVVIYSAVFLLASALLAQVYTVTRKTQQTTASAYAVTGQTDTAMHWLRRDVTETALSSVRSYPGPTGIMKPALTMASARSIQGGENSRRSMLISEYGVPAWSYNIFYGLQKEQGAETGDLVRWEVPVALKDNNRIPQVATMPTSMSDVVAPRVVLRNVLCPGRTVQNLIGLSSGFPASDWGGFRTEFVRRQGGESGTETTSPVNPALNVAGAADNTRLVEVELRISEASAGSPNFYTVKFRVFPRY